MLHLYRGSAAEHLLRETAFKPQPKPLVLYSISCFTYRQAYSQGALLR
jgi:hypothetical protein